jgi:hypothetical protein
MDEELPMPADSSLINFRVPSEDHDLIRAVAHYRNETVSTFVRDSVLASVRAVIAEVGPQTVMEGDRRHEDERRSAAQQRLEERLESIRRQIADGRETPTEPKRMR